MTKFVIVTDSTTDLPQELVEQHGLLVLPLKYHLEVGGKVNNYTNFVDYREQDIKEFYSLVKSGAKASTSQLNSEDYIGELTPYLKKGIDVLILSFSSKLSGTYNSARLAKIELEEQFPERKIVLVDTKAASLGEGMLVTLAAKEQAKGKSIEEVEKFVVETSPQVAHWFTVDDINHLRRGGRISAAASVVAKALSIKPILHCDDEGSLVSRNKAISRKKAIRSLFSKMLETALPNQEEVYIGHGDDLEAAEFLKSLILEQYPNVNVLIHTIGPVIGAHTGQGVLALFFLATNR